MNSYINQVANDISLIDPQLVKKYLETHGWQLEYQFNEKAGVFSTRKNDKKFSVLLPLTKDVDDFEDRIIELMRTLELYEERSVSKIVSNVISSSELAKKKKREVFSLKLLYLYEQEKKEASAKKVGSLLSSLQELFDAVGQSEAGRPSQSNKMPKDIAERTELSIFETFQGSFGVKLALSSYTAQLNFLDDSLEEKISETFLELIKCSNKDDKEMLKEHLIRLKRKSATKYKKFLSSIIDSESNISVDWGSFNPEKGGQAELSYSNALKTIEFIKKMEEEDPEEYDLIGELIAANKRKRTIELEEVNTGKKVSGKFRDIIINNEFVELTIGRTYHATIQEVLCINPATGEEKLERTIVEIIPFSLLEPS